MTNWLLDVEFEGREMLQARAARVALVAPPPPWRRSPFEFDVLHFTIPDDSPPFLGGVHLPVGADSNAHGSSVQVMLLVDVRARSLYSIRVQDITGDRAPLGGRVPLHRRLRRAVPHPRRGG